jgi:hypothetical protein
MELGQAVYNHIMGVSVFIVVSSLQNHTYVYMFNEQMNVHARIGTLASFLKIVRNSDG